MTCVLVNYIIKEVTFTVSRSRKVQNFIFMIFSQRKDERNNYLINVYAPRVHEIDVRVLDLKNSGKQTNLLKLCEAIAYPTDVRYYDVAKIKKWI
jgi:hypothetical protein